MVPKGTKPGHLQNAGEEMLYRLPPSPGSAAGLAVR
jgi:hypothetical protein